MARYICIEGTDGIGKTTQAKLLYDDLKNRGFKVLLTKEPGTAHAPMTLKLRNLMLNKEFDNEITDLARELISQAIRSIHLENVIMPAHDKYDFIIQDRGLLSGVAYGTACGHDTNMLFDFGSTVLHYAGLVDIYSLYDDIVYLKGSTSNALYRALKCKAEFNSGDAIEAKGAQFMYNVSCHMDKLSNKFKNVHVISVENKNISAVYADIQHALQLYS